MKKLFLLIVAAGLTASAFAQRIAHAEPGQTNIVNNNTPSHSRGVAARTTAVGDTDVLSHISSTDTITIYGVGSNADSGYTAGTDAYGDQAFAERYDIDSTDSTVEVIGVASLFGGTISAVSAKTITFNVWSVAPQSAVGAPNVFYSGLPSTVLTSLANVPVTALGIGLGGAPDSGSSYLFTTPTAYLRTSFFIGYNINYTFAALDGDTIGLYSNQDGDRLEAGYTLSGTDTILNDVNVTMYSDNTWHDDAQDNFNIFYNLEIFPIVKIGNGTLSVKGITRNDFTFFGNYPNPAVNSTNIKFSLAKSTDVTIVISDMNGRTVNTISQPGLSAGEHIIPVATNSMDAGNYIYAIHTATGDGIASVMTIVK